MEFIFYDHKYVAKFCAITFTLEFISLSLCTISICSMLFGYLTGNKFLF
jgi:hypothetical protein